MRPHLAALAATVFAGAASAQLTAHQQLTRDIYQELVESRTVTTDGDVTAAARAMQRRLLEAGFEPRDVLVLEPAPRKGNLVARLRGTGELKPVLLLAHLDVVEAKREDWSDSLDPFKLTERDGYFYGRGVIDDKAMAAIFVANLIRYRQEGWKPRRDLIVALTADEEGGTHNGVGWLLKEHRTRIDAEFALNEGGAGQMRQGKPYLHGVQVGEKMYLSFDLEATHPGGHSSVPGRVNAIYELAAALQGVAAMELPARVNYVLRGLAAKLVDVEQGEMSQALAAVAAGNPTEAQLKLVSTVPQYNAQLRTTCVATRLEGGHADNALPQRAKATVNCRLLPGEDPEFVAAQLRQAAGARVTVTARGMPSRSEATDARSPVMATIQRVSEGMWPGIPVIPTISAGATDGSRLRNAEIPTYGVSGLFLEMGENRLHGRDERLPVKSFFEASEFLDRLVRAFGSGG